MLGLSNRLVDFDSSDFQLVVSKGQELVDPIDLSIGIPEELTPEHIKIAGIEAIRNNKTTYAPANGLIELRQALAEKLLTENGVAADPDHISIVPGLTTGLLLVYLAIFNPGDEVIIFDPCYPPYPYLATIAGAIPIMVGTLPTFQPDLDAVRASITHKTKAIVINSPNNPTGAVYSEETLRELAAIATEHELYLISDEIYEYFTFEPKKHFSVGSIYPNTITMNGFSKAYAMTGWRLGYIHAPLDVIGAINQLQQYVVFSSSSIAQHAALAALQNRPDLHDRYKTKRDLLHKALLSMGYEIHGLQGAFFAFIQAPNDQTDIEFTNRALANNLLLVPGRAFSSRHGFVRLSYGASLHTLERGIEVLRKISF